MLKAHHPKHHRRPRYLQTLLLLVVAAYLGAEQSTPLPRATPRTPRMHAPAWADTHHVLLPRQRSGTGICRINHGTPRQQLTTRCAEHDLVRSGSGAVQVMVQYECHRTRRWVTES